MIVGGSGSIHEAVTGMLGRTDNKSFKLGLLPSRKVNSVFKNLFYTDSIKSNYDLAKATAEDRKRHSCQEHTRQEEQMGILIIKTES